MKPLPLWKKIGFVLLYTAFVAIAAYFRGENNGKEACEKAHKVEIKQSKELLEKHEKTLEVISTQSGDDAVKQFHQDNGSK